MARYGIAVNTENCMECYNCFMACKDEHCGFKTAVSAPQPHTGHKWIRIESKERGNDTRKIKTSNSAVLCAHCHDAPCAKAAENGAVYTRGDGIVIIDPDKAKGQKKLVSSCPIGAIFWNEELNIPQKCTLCAHLLDDGYAMPRCAEACPNEALYFGDLDDPNSEINRVIKEGRITKIKTLGGIETNVVHLNIPTVFLAGSVYLPDDEAAEGALVTLTRKKTGDTVSVKTNYFGDWEADWLAINEDYEITISANGCLPVKFEAKTDIDRFVGETVLTPC
ncbi:MAG: oxidoreductase [Oscillospiraceae bacterium]|nr:oxidoreductase [Oscillospiraceae bacterium]